MKDLVTCPVCLDMLKDPVACTECAGTVCRACRNDNSRAFNEIYNNNDNNNNNIRECALCRAHAACKPGSETIRFLDTLRFHCAHRDNGCDVQSVYSNLVDHIQACRHKLTYEQLLNLTNTQQQELLVLKAELAETKKALIKETSRSAALANQI